MKSLFTSIALLFAAMAFTLNVTAQPKLEFITPDIVRVQWTPDGVLKDNATGVCTYRKQNVTAPQIIVKEDGDAHALTFIDKNTGNVLLRENRALPRESEQVVQERVIYDEKSAHTVQTANGMVTERDVIRRDTIGRSMRYRIHFDFTPEEGLYGFGSHMEDYMNLNGKTLYLTQHNLKASIPMLCSTKGYGLLFDSGCAMKFENGVLELDATKEIDYYFIKGKTLEDVVAGYRYLTGQVSLPPRYVFGYTQSKERYVSSDDIIGVLKEYRRRNVPIDMIVQDWNYWPQGWGYMKMDPKYYPSPKALADSVHALNAKLMVSIWPNPQWCPEADDFKARGMMLEHDVYDVFNPEARKHYWSYADKEFFSNGFDAWWCDSSEPLDGDWNTPPSSHGAYSWDSHSVRYELNKNILSDALGAERSNLYSLYHSMGIYENQRATGSTKRVVNLTRSTYAGQQRYGTIVWNGDTHASWDSFRQQIPSGLNYMATGNPYWTVDVGSFFTGTDGRWFRKGQFPDGVKDEEYREYYTRMFQWATFLPVLRSHGSDTPREIWRFDEDGNHKYYNAILDMIRLRYAMIPYIYSMAAMQTFGGYTMARPLAFDFASDNQVLDIKEEYMFGDFLVCPVTHPLSETTVQKVYLPAGEKWFDFNTREQLEGGQWIDCKLDISNFPLFVKAGSIIPMCFGNYENAVQQIGEPITVGVFPGKDAEFTYYEDEGDNYNYENGAYSTIRMHWNDAAKAFTLDARNGSYPGMKPSVKITVCTPSGKKTITYKGKKKVVKL